MGWTTRLCIIVLVLASMQAVLAAEFGCEIRLNETCFANETLLIRLNSSESGAAPNNSHAQLENYSGDLYAYSVCCWTDAFRTLTNSCDGNGAAVLSLYDASDSHVQAATQSGYVWDACMNVTAGTVECEYPDDACSAGYSEVVSIASSEIADDNLTNAHVADFGFYQRKVCCRVGGQNPPAVESANLTPINTTRRSDLECGNGSVTDADGDAVTLHYNWFVNGTSVTVLNLPMDYDSTGSVTHDISGYENHGTVNGATFLPTGGAVGGAFDFDGVNDYINAGNSSELNFGTGPFTIYVRVRAGTQTSRKMILDKKNGSSTTAGYQIWSSGDPVRFTISDGASSVTVIGSDHIESAWGTYAFVRNESGVFAYEGSQLIGSSASGGSFDIDNTLNLIIGANSSVSDGFFDGQIDEILIFNRSLTPAEVQTLYDLSNKHLNRSELRKTDYWNCSMTPIDSTGLNGTTVYSNETYVEGSIPANVTLVYPADGNDSIFERIVNFTWIAAEEPDGDAVTYVLNLTVEPGACSVETAQTGLTATNYTYGTLCVDQRYWWNITACDVDGCSGVNHTNNFTIASVISLFFNISTAQLGDLVRLETVATDINASTEALQLQNIGNVQVNVSIVANNSPFSSETLPTSDYQFKASINESGAFNESGSATTYTQFTTSYQHLLKQLNYTTGMNLARIDLNITAPVDEPPGQKRGNITVQGVSVE